MKNFIKLLSIITLICFTTAQSNSAEKTKLLKTDWSFKGVFGKFDRGSLQRGYQVYTEVCSSCHSMKYVIYRNLGEKGGLSFGLMPNTSVGYNLISREYDVDNEILAATAYKGQGGTSKVFLGFGYEVAKGLNLGIQGNYVFGKITAISRPVFPSSRGVILLRA